MPKQHGPTISGTGQKYLYSNLTIAVIGDYCEDRWYEAESVGICPGTVTMDIINPTLILKKPGMAGNIHENIKSLGAKSDLYVPFPQIEEHKKLYYSLKGDPLPRTSIHPSFSYEECNDTVAMLLQNLMHYNAVIIADYNKGWTPDAFAKIMEECLDSDIPIMVDPKFLHWEIFKGASIIKPNKVEWGRKIYHPQYDNVVVTLGEEGIQVFNVDGEWSIPGRKVEVADITGAGDTCMAVLTLEYLRTGGDILKAAYLANIAGSLVVQHRYTACVTVEELRKAGGWDD